MQTNLINLHAVAFVYAFLLDQQRYDPIWALTDTYFAIAFEFWIWFQIENLKSKMVAASEVMLLWLPWKPIKQQVVSINQKYKESSYVLLLISSQSDEWCQK